MKVFWLPAPVFIMGVVATGKTEFNSKYIIKIRKKKLKQRAGLQGRKKTMLFFVQWPAPFPETKPDFEELCVRADETTTLFVQWPVRWQFSSPRLLAAGFLRLWPTPSGILKIKVEPFFCIYEAISKFEYFQPCSALGKDARNGDYAAAHALVRVKTLQRRKTLSFFMWTLQIENMNVS